MSKKLIYVASAYSTGNINENIENVKKYCRFVSNLGNVPIAPHLLFPQFMDDNNKDERALAFEYNKFLLTKVDELWVFGELTSGMKIEVGTAREINLPIRYFKTW